MLGGLHQLKKKIWKTVKVHSCLTWISKLKFPKKALWVCGLSAAIKIMGQVSGWEILLSNNRLTEKIIADYGWTFADMESHLIVMARICWQIWIATTAL